MKSVLWNEELLLYLYKKKKLLNGSQHDYFCKIIEKLKYCKRPDSVKYYKRLEFFEFSWSCQNFVITLEKYHIRVLNFNEKLFWDLTTSYCYENTEEMLQFDYILNKFEDFVTP